LGLWSREKYSGTVEQRVVRRYDRTFDRRLVDQLIHRSTRRRGERSTGHSPQGVKVASNPECNPEISRERSYIGTRAAAHAEPDPGGPPVFNLELIHRYLPRLGLHVYSLASQSIEPLTVVPNCCIPGWHLVDRALEGLQTTLDIEQLEMRDLA
jgi:hypothetical protein